PPGPPGAPPARGRVRIRDRPESLAEHRPARGHRRVLRELPRPREQPVRPMDAERAATQPRRRGIPDRGSAPPRGSNATIGAGNWITLDQGTDLSLVLPNPAVNPAEPTFTANAG